MLTTVSVLIIVLGLMVSLARYVRKSSAEQLTRQLLQTLDDVAREHLSRTPGGLDHVSAFLPDDVVVIDIGEARSGERPAGAPGGAISALPTEPLLQRAALKNNEDFVRVLRGDIVRATMARAGASTGSTDAGAAPGSGAKAAPTLAERLGLSASASSRFGSLPVSLYDEVTLRDAWGNPIVFMPHNHRAIGMATGQRQAFFFSAGPDGRYLTRDDNLYSYEAPARTLSADSAAGGSDAKPPDRRTGPAAPE